MRSALLVIDTATSHTVVALRAAPGGPPHDGSSAGGERSGASLGSRLAALLTRTGLGPRDLAAVGVGTGPGSFTGLRVGLATGKALAWSLSIPLVGIPTAEALRRAAGIATGADAATLAVLQPAGARDHYLALPGEPPRLAPPGTDLAGALLGHALVAVDVEAGRVAGCRGPLGLDPVDAGAAARERLGDALLGLLEERLAAGATDDPAALVPVYVALPKGASGPAAVATGSAWTPDLR